MPPERGLPVVAWATVATPFGSALVHAAFLDLGRGEEPPGSNLGPYVAELGAPFGLVPPFNYCSSAVAKWLRVAAETSGQPSPIVGAPLSKATMRQLQEVGLWTPIADMAAFGIPQPGALLIWDMSDPNKPETEQAGHIGVLEALDSFGNPVTIEANHSSVVQRVVRAWDDPRLLGVGPLGGWSQLLVAGPPAPTSAGPFLAFAAGSALAWYGVRRWRRGRFAS